MSNFMDRLAKGVEELASRRRFLGTVGKAASGLAALIVGETMMAGKAFASACPDCIHPDDWPYCSNGPAFCCDSSEPSCGIPGCPANTTLSSYTWACCYNHRTMICYDCNSTCYPYDVVCSYAKQAGTSVAQAGTKTASRSGIKPNYIPC